MTEITIYGQVLTANKEERTFSGLMLPFGEVGHTSAGAVRAAKGVVRLPADPSLVHLNLEHDGLRPVGKAVSFEEKEDGIHATFRVAKTTAGNDLLAEIEEGLRASLSVELANVSIRSGELLAGDLTGCGAVVRPAFPSAAIYSLTASDMGETISEKETTMDNNSVENVEAIEASAPVQAAPLYAANSKTDLGKVTFEAFQRGGAPAMTAALADQLTTDDAGKAFIKDQEIGTLWEARKTERKIVSAVGVKPLESLVVTGSKKARTFAVADWLGNKTALPTGKFTTSRETWVAKRKAAAVDIAIELVEFGGPGVVSELYTQAMDSYITQTEDELVDYLVTEATTVATATSVLGAINKAAATLGAIGARMDVVVCSPDVYAELQEINSADAPWWLAQQSSVNIGNGSANVGGVLIESNASLPANSVLAFDSRAIDYRESRDIKLEAYNVAQGGLDIAFIKVRSQYVTDNGAVLLFTAVGNLAV